ncbi:MAG TPA: GTPase HflX, partial [Methylococcaceae bacterium]|nr:GTPase HflX [Methylococcaceae bacterium]
QQGGIRAKLFANATILEEIEHELGDSELLIDIDAKYLGLLKEVQCDVL